MGNSTGKPSWSDAPDWAKYLAQDANGRWYWWGCKPEIFPHADQFLVEPSGMHGYIRAGRGDPNPQWRETLEPRPTKE